MKAKKMSSKGRATNKSPSAFMTISEVADSMNVQQHVLRFWESKFNYIKPMKRGGGRRFYGPEDVKIIKVIRDLLYNDGYTIKGVQKLLREKGIKAALSNDNITKEDAETFIVSDQDKASVLDHITHDVISLNSIKKDALLKVRVRLEVLRNRLKQEMSA
jgi:DNA-binding transcriptional MerR regulator